MQKSFLSKLFNVASISFVVRTSTPIIEDSSNPPFKMILCLYLLLESLSKICSKKLLAYTLETVIAEKYQTIIARDIYNTRMKDFYDIYILIKENAHLLF